MVWVASTGTDCRCGYCDAFEGVHALNCVINGHIRECLPRADAFTRAVKCSLTAVGAARPLGKPAKIDTPRGVIEVARGRGCVSCDASDRAPGTENGPAVVPAQ